MRPLKWNKDKNIRDAGHWLASKIELIELKDEILKNNQKSILNAVEYLMLNLAGETLVRRKIN